MCAASILDDPFLRDETFDILEAPVDVERKPTNAAHAD